MADELNIKITGDGKEAIETFRDVEKEASGALQGVEKAAEESVGEATSKLDGLRSKLGELDWGKIGAGAAGAAAVVGGALFKVGSDFDEVFDGIRVGTGATGDDLEALKDDFKAVFRSVPTDAATAGAAIADLNTYMGLAGEPLQEMATQYINLGRITGEDVPSLINQGSRAFNDWNIATDDQSEALDYLFKVAQSTGIGVGDLMGKVTQFGAPLRQMGFDFETSAAMLGKFEQQGVNAEQVMGGMNRAASRFAAEGVPDSKAALAELMDNIQNAATDSEATALALDYFGTRAGPELANAIRSGKFSVEELIESIHESGETINALAEETDDAAESLTVFKNRALVAIEPVASKIFDLGGKSLGAVGALGSLGAGIGGLQAAGVGVTGALGKLTGVLGTVLSPTKLLTAAQTALNLVMSLNPIALVVIALAALAAGLVLAYKNSETFRKIVDAAFGKVKDAAEAMVRFFTDKVVPFFRDTIPDVFGRMRDKAVEIWTGVRDRVTGLVQGLRDAVDRRISDLRDLLDRLWEGIKSKAEAIWSGLRDTVVNLATNVKDRVTGAVTDARDTLAKLWDGIKAKAEGVWTGLRDTVVNLATTVKERVTGAITDARDTLARLWEEIGRKAGDTWEAIKRTIETGRQAIFDALKWPFERLRDTVGSIMGAAYGFLKGPLNSAIGGLETFVNALIGALRWVGEKLGISALSDLANRSFPRLPDVPTYARGTDYHPGGLAIVGEEGPEIALLPRGSQVIPHAESMRLLAGADGPAAKLAGLGGPLDVAKGVAGAIKGAVSGIASTVKDWAARGAAWVINQALGKLGLTLSLPGIFSSIATSALTMVTDGLNQFVQGLIDDLKAKVDAEEAAAAAASGEVPGPLSPGGWVRPASGRISQEYGPASGALGYTFHTGIDIANNQGTPIYAAKAGTVTASGWNNYGLGYMIGIGHGGGLRTVYGHMTTLLAGIGKVVEAGDRIGLMGSTGNSTGPHLHFETWANGAHVNPRKYVAFASGGILREPVFGRGLRTGTLYSFAEREAERFTPVSRDGGGGVSVEFHGPVTIEAHDRHEAERAASDVGWGVMAALRSRGMAGV